MTENGIAQQIFEAKWVCNGFPKSGTHLLVQLIQPLAPYQPATDAGLFEKPWSGTFLDNSWTNRWAPIEHTAFKLARVANGHMLKAHLGFTPELERFMYLLGCIHVFIYRDLRDVAVSQAYHIINSEKPGYELSEDEELEFTTQVSLWKPPTLVHPEPEAYGPLEDFDGVLEKVIAGVDRFPGVVDRWEMYAGWLNVPWVLCVRYEQVLAERQEWARRIFQHAMRQHAVRWGKQVSFDPHGLDVVTSVMAKASTQTERSPTFRKGVAGGWQEAFTQRHMALWKQHDPDHWLVRLGYEEEGWYADTTGAVAAVPAIPAAAGT